MRLRNVTRADSVIEQSELVIKNPAEYKGGWRSLFGNDNPLYIEVGMGKGRFLTTLAQQNPDINYIGIEKYTTVILRALEKQELLRLPNLKLVLFNADNITDIFDKDEVDKIYLNFSDPWPKDRHANRRLTSGRFLERYTHFLKKDGCVEFKTDNRSLFDFSVEEAKAAGWRQTVLTYDLHNSEFAEGNVMTEYEEKFSSLGNPIHKLVIFQP